VLYEGTEKLINIEKSSYIFAVVNEGGRFAFHGRCLSLLEACICGIFG